MKLLKKKFIIPFHTFLVMLHGCCSPEYENLDLEGKRIAELPGNTRAEKLDYLFDNSELGCMILTVREDEWNQLLANCRNPSKKENYVKANCTWEKSFNYNGEKYKVKYNIDNCGLRVRGGSESYQPPEEGETHVSEQCTCYSSCCSPYRQTHFKLKFDEFYDDDEHTVEEIVKGVNLKCMRQDPCYVSEMYTYDLMRKFDVWTGARASYCMLYIQVGNGEPAYFGMYKTIEAVNKQFLKARCKSVGGGNLASGKGFLWKCGGGTLLSADNMGVEENGNSVTYELKTDEEYLETAKIEFADFIDKLNNLPDDEFAVWIEDFMDIDLFIKTLAVETVCRKWDNYWGNQNNYYLYFDTAAKKRLYFISYDCDNSLNLPESMNIPQLAWETDSDPQNEHPLTSRILRIEHYLQAYKEALTQLINPQKDLFFYEQSEARISNWYSLIEPYCYDYDAQPCFYGKDTPSYFYFTPNYSFSTPLSGCGGFFTVIKNRIETYTYTAK